MNFGGANLQKMMKQAQKMQKDMQDAQERLKTLEVEGSAGGGMVKVKMTAANQLLDVAIAPEVVDPEDVEMLQDLVLAAVSDAMNKAAEVSAEELGKVTGGMNLPF